MPGINVVIKIPKSMDEKDRAMEETHLIEVLYDWMDCQDFVVKTREELIVCDSQTRQIIFYCAFYERVKTEMHQSIPTKVTSEKEYLDILGTFLIYFS